MPLLTEQCGLDGGKLPSCIVIPPPDTKQTSVDPDQMDYASTRKGSGAAVGTKHRLSGKPDSSVGARKRDRRCYLEEEQEFEGDHPGCGGIFGRFNNDFGGIVRSFASDSQKDGLNTSRLARKLNTLPDDSGYSIGRENLGMDVSLTGKSQYCPGFDLNNSASTNPLESNRFGFMNGSPWPMDYETMEIARMQAAKFMEYNTSFDMSHFPPALSESGNEVTVFPPDRKTSGMIHPLQTQNTHETRDQSHIYSKGSAIDKIRPDPMLIDVSQERYPQLTSSSTSDADDQIVRTVDTKHTQQPDSVYTGSSVSLSPSSPAGSVSSTSLRESTGQLEAPTQLSEITRTTTALGVTGTPQIPSITDFSLANPDLFNHSGMLNSFRNTGEIYTSELTYENPEFLPRSSNNGLTTFHPTLSVCETPSSQLRMDALGSPLDSEAVAPFTSAGEYRAL